MKALIFSLSVFLVIGCKSAPDPVPADQSATFGAELSDAQISSFAEVVKQLETSDKIENIKLQAQVEAVCQTKGCWMNLVSEDAPGQEMFVKFKDYGFFMPKDIAGRKVIIEGEAFVEETSVDELRHYAEDEGKSEEEIAAITEPVKEVKFMATGVKLLPKKG